MLHPSFVITSTIAQLWLRSRAIQVSAFFQLQCCAMINHSLSLAWLFRCQNNTEHAYRNTSEIRKMCHEFQDLPVCDIVTVYTCMQIVRSWATVKAFWFVRPHVLLRKHFGLPDTVFLHSSAASGCAPSIPGMHQHHFRFNSNEKEYNLFYQMRTLKTCEPLVRLIPVCAPVTFPSWS